MSPTPFNLSSDMALQRRESLGRPDSSDGLVLEGWAQGFMVGSLIVMSCITIANMRRGVLLHKLILLELLLGIWHGFWVLFHDPIYTWWLSISAILLNASWTLHNVVAWMKIKPFLPQWASRIFIGTVILVIPYWIVEIFANFQYFHGWGNIFLKTRPWEPLCRDPWWVFTTIALFYNILTRYELTVWEMLRISPRFIVMLSAMLVSVLLIVPDVLSVTHVLDSALPTGINPFFKLSFVFKCLTDTVVLDDFKTALDRLRAFQMGRMGSLSVDNGEADRRYRGEGRNSWPSAGRNVDGNASFRESRINNENVEHPRATSPESQERDLEANMPILCDRQKSGCVADSQRVSRVWTSQGSEDSEYAQAMREITKDGSRNQL